MIIKKRGKDKIKEHFSLKSAYRYFCKNNPDVKIDAKEYRKIIYEANDAIINKIIYNNLKFLIPARLGYLEIKKSKKSPKLDKNGNLITKSLPIDHGSTLKLWQEDEEAFKTKKRIYHLNEHTEGYLLKFKWDKFSALIKNKSIYSFTACRKATRALASAVKQNPDIDFYEY